MAKSLLEVKCAGRRFKVHIKDIYKVFRVNKKPFPKVPAFQQKSQPVTESEGECQTMLEQTQ